MPQISPRITTLNGDGSDGWGLFHKARRMKDAGHQITELTIGEHDIGTDQSILDAMHRAGLTYFPKASEAKVVTFRKGW